MGGFLVMVGVGVLAVAALASHAQPVRYAFTARALTK